MLYFGVLLAALFNNEYQGIACFKCKLPCMSPAIDLAVAEGYLSHLELLYIILILYCACFFSCNCSIIHEEYIWSQPRGVQVVRPIRSELILFIVK